MSALGTTIIPSPHGSYSASSGSSLNNRPERVHEQRQISIALLRPRLSSPTFHAPPGDNDHSARVTPTLLPSGVPILLSPLQRKPLKGWKTRLLDLQHTEHHSSRKNAKGWKAQDIRGRRRPSSNINCASKKVQESVIDEKLQEQSTVG